MVEDGVNRDGTEDVCRDRRVTYICRHRRSDAATVPFSNPAIPINMGIRAAHGEILILQNPECTHQGRVIQTLVDNLLAITTTSVSHPGSPAAVFAAVSARDSGGSHISWLTHPDHSPRPLFFCGAIHRGIMIHIRGLDEDYLYCGCEDADLGQRLANEGHQLIFLPDTDAVVHHQYHPRCAAGDVNELLCRQAEINTELWERKREQRANRDIGDIRNIGRAWGVDRNPLDKP